MYRGSAVIFIVLYLCAYNIDAQFIRGPSFRNALRSYKPGVASTPSTEDGELDGKHHPCYRICDGRPKTCYYHFSMEWYQSMSKACFDCPFNITHCGSKDCVVGNGLGREITVINRKLPGPSIQVCHNDMVIVNVTNELMAAGTSIHWHGMHQMETPYMDGVPFVTQCPITPESTFTYKFKAAQAGTHFYHAHIGLQRGDGISGSLIVRQPRVEEPDLYKYDKDFADHVMLVMDWTNQPAQSIYTDHYHFNASMNPSSLLINGGGKFEVRNGGRTAMTQAPRFNVTKYFSYRFRLINAGFSYCPVEVSVENHDITLIASDGFYLEPVKTKSFVSYAGERFDFIINANQVTGNYWIKFRGLLNCENLVDMRQVAVLHYDSASDGEPLTAPDWTQTTRGQINPVNQGEEQTANTPMSKLNYIKKDLYDDTLKTTPDYKFFVAYDLYIKDNNHFNKPGYYGHKDVDKQFSVPTPQFNNISMQLPTSPLLVTRPSKDNFCNSDTIKAKNEEEKCRKNFCQCPHVLDVKLNSVVEVIIIDEGGFTDANHPIHLHGHMFRVIGMERLRRATNAQEIMDLDRAGKLHRNLNGTPPMKDTVTVPDGGYTIIRFKADNPGYWLFHCHIEFHAEIGMALVFKVGEHEDMLPVPQNFPTCGNFGSNGGSGAGNNGVNGGNGIGNNNMGINLPNNVYAQVKQQYNAYHSLLEMPMGGQMEIVYKPPQIKN